MKLNDLEPRWIHPNIFVFLCPCCRKVLLSCKDKAMTYKECFDALKAGLGDGNKMTVVPPAHDFAWNITSSHGAWQRPSFFDDCTVTPSIDASPAGHWHGFITNGEIK